MLTPEQWDEINAAPTIGDEPQSSTTAVTCPARADAQPDSFAAPPWGNAGVAYPPYSDSAGGVVGWIHDHPGWFLLLLLAGVMAYESMEGDDKKKAANAR